jgi:glycosyltransferase involved in cell wall biosynthesis
LKPSDDSLVKAMQPHILLMPDKRGWAFDFHCSYQAEALRQRCWHVDVIYLLDRKPPPLPLSAYDLAFNPIYSPQPIDRKLRGKLVRGIYGHKWAWSANPRQTLDRSLNGVVAVIVPNRKLQTMIGWYFPKTFQINEGTDPNLFRFYRQRSESNLVAGWTGDPRHTWKRLDEIVRPACLQAGVELRVATVLTREQLVEFYNDVDIVLVASIEEGSPNAVFEAGACGRTAVGTAVGIIPEAIVDGKNGFIVDGTVQAFADKLLWCKEHLDQVRAMGLMHREVVLRRYTVQREAEDFADLMTMLLCDLELERRLSTKYFRVMSTIRRKVDSARRKIASIWGTANASH